ncbi:MAG: hypothetical protein LAO55_20415 [Acidobacteriia bacterium]|jgi:hypothetical protein|nr:hypothetical protein [Terriglobia bacterium]
MKHKPASSVRKGFNQKAKGFDQKKDVRAIARERVGTVKPSRPILPPTLRKKPKHKRPPGEVEE